MPVWIFLGIIFTIGAVVPPYLHTIEHGAFSPLYGLLSFFLVINLVICLWELCLFFRMDNIIQRNAGFKQDSPEDRIKPTIALFTARVTPANAFSPLFWSEVWAAYSVYDGSYADRRTFGFAGDIGNGFATLIPTLILHIGMTYEIMPANILGMLALVVFYQMFYLTFLYWVSFFVNKRHQRLVGKELLMFIIGTNAPWFVVPAIGLYTAVTLILTNNYSILGF